MCIFQNLKKIIKIIRDGTANNEIMHSDIRSETLINIHKHLHRGTLRTWSIGLQSRSIIPMGTNRRWRQARYITCVVLEASQMRVSKKKRERKREKCWSRASARRRIASCPFAPRRRTTVFCTLRRPSAKEKRYDDINLTCTRAHCYDNVFKCQPRVHEWRS